jgi:hypothetical protein
MKFDHVKRMITLTSDNIKRLSLYIDCFSQNVQPEIQSNVTEEVVAPNTTKQQVITAKVTNESDQSGKEEPKKSGNAGVVDSEKDESVNSGEFIESQTDKEREEIDNFSRAIHRFSQNMLVEVKSKAHA